MKHAPEKSLDLTPVERDTHMFRMMIVRFRRDASGKVTGFVYDNPVVKGIQFTRLGDRKLWPRLPPGGVRYVYTAHAHCAPFSDRFLLDVAQ